jgi:hypothetical protein
MPLGRKQCTSAIITWSQIIDFHPRESPCTQNYAFNKFIVKDNQLRPDLWFSPCKVGLWTSLVLSPPHTDAAVMSHKSPSKFVIDTKTRTTIASWYVSNVSIIFDVPCLFVHHLLSVFTSWHFYAFSGTNLLTRCHSASSKFSAIFMF